MNETINAPYLDPYEGGLPEVRCEVDNMRECCRRDTWILLLRGLWWLAIKCRKPYWDFRLFIIIESTLFERHCTPYRGGQE